jgi:hypothetical protein
MGVSLVYIGIIVGTLALVLGITLLGMRLARWRRDVALRRHGAPILVMPLADDASGNAPRPVLSRVESAENASRSPAQAPVSMRRITPPATPAAPNAAEATRRALPAQSSMPDEPGDTIDTGPFRAGEMQPGSPSAHLVAGAQVRFFRAEEGTLEFLPGRLEIVGGEDVGHEIFFARQMGETRTTMTFGRSEGPPLRHIQLLDPTVSRQHAQMTWDGERWHLTNLSSTNAVVLDGRPLETSGQEVVLEDGARIEMGAVTFVFHGR